MSELPHTGPHPLRFSRRVVARSVIRTSSASAVHPVSAASYAPAPASLSSSDGEAAPPAKVRITAEEFHGLLQRIELLERRLNAHSTVGKNADMEMEDM